MIDRQELTDEINAFYKDKILPDGILYKSGHTTLSTSQFVAVNLRIVNSETPDKFWNLAFQMLNDLRVALVDKTYTVVELKESINLPPPAPPPKKKEKKVEEKQVPIKREPLVLNPPAVKKVEVKKQLEQNTPPPTLF